MRERFEQRLFRIFAQAGYSPVQLLTITPEEMVEVRVSPCRISARCCAFKQGAGRGQHRPQGAAGGGAFERDPGKETIG